METWTLDQNPGLGERANQTIAGALGWHVLQSDNASHLTEGPLCLRRGFKKQLITGSGWSGDVKWIGRHVTNLGAEELWGASNNAGTAALARRTAFPTTYSAVTYSDTVVVADLLYHHSATLDGKLFLAYNSNVNRLHVWDGTALRRVGMTAPGVVTVADFGAGAYPATGRLYRTSQRIKSGTNILAQSELSPSAAFVPSGAGAAARITKSATVDSATHWVVYGLIGTAGDVYDLYEELAEIAVGTTTYDDTALPSAYSGDAPAELGINVPPPSPKFIVADAEGGRLIMGGAWETTAAAGETTPKPNRLWFTRRLGTSDLGDDESIPNSITFSYFMDIGDAGPITGLAGPIYGEIYVFKRRSTGKLVPTGNEITPYRYVPISNAVGALDQRLIAELGHSSVAFADATTVYTVGADSSPVPISDPLGVSLSYTLLTTTAWLAFDQWDKKLYVFPGASASGYVLDTTIPRWGTFTFGGGSVMNRGVMAEDFEEIGQRLIVAGVGPNGTSALMLASGSLTPKDGDETTGVVATVRARKMAKPGYFFELMSPTVWYRAPDATGVLTLTVTYDRQDGDSRASGNVTLPITTTAVLAAGTKYAVGVKTLENMGLSDATVADVTITLQQAGGAGSVTSPPTIDLVTIPYKVHQAVAR